MRTMAKTSLIAQFAFDVMRQKRDNKRDCLGITAMAAPMDSLWKGSADQNQEMTHAYSGTFSS